MNSCLQKSVVLFVLLNLAVAGFAQDKKKEKPKEESPKKKADTQKVKKGPFRIEVTASGYLESGKMHEVVIRPKAWAEFAVVEAVTHGSRVKKGDQLIKLDMKKIDEQIEERERGLEAWELSFKAAELELKLLEESTPLDLAAAERAKKQADENYQRYQKIDRPMAVKSAQKGLESAENYLLYAKEELKQLEKMYKADDLTEETEEIILKRTRDSVKRSQFSLDKTRLVTEKTLKVDLPRQDIAMKDALKRSHLAFIKAHETLPRTLVLKRRAFEKLKRDGAKSEEYLGKLKKDRAAMDFHAPVDGIVYYGSASRGKWAGVAALGGMLKKGGGFKANQVLMTIVSNRPLIARVDVNENQVRHLKSGVAGVATFTVDPTLRAVAKLKSVAIAPMAPGKFDAQVTIVGKGLASSVMPGMACRIKLTAYSKDDAITLPNGAVFADDEDLSKRHVFVKTEIGHEKRSVKTGRSTDKKTEILDGLNEGEVVLLKKPE